MENKYDCIDINFFKFDNKYIFCYVEKKTVLKMINLHLVYRYAGSILDIILNKN